VSQKKTSTFYFLNNCQKLTDFNDFWHVKSWEVWHENLKTCPPHLSDVATLPREIQKVIFNSIIHTYFWLFVLFQKKKKLIHLPTPPENVTTLTCELQNIFIWLKVYMYCVLWNVGDSEEPLVGCRRRFWKEPVVVCGNWNVRQEMSQQVIRVTTFCLNRCFQSFSTLNSRTVHHAVLKFSPCRNKPLPQASTCPHQHTRSSRSMPKAQN